MASYHKYGTYGTYPQIPRYVNRIALILVLIDVKDDSGLLNSLETVAMRPAGGGNTVTTISSDRRERGGRGLRGDGSSISSCSCTLRMSDVSEQTRCSTLLCPIRFLQHSHLRPRLRLCLAVFAPSMKDTATNLEQHKSRRSSPVAGYLRLERAGTFSPPSLS